MVSGRKGTTKLHTSNIIVQKIAILYKKMIKK